MLSLESTLFLNNMCRIHLILGVSIAIYICVSSKCCVYNNARQVVKLHTKIAARLVGMCRDADIRIILRCIAWNIHNRI